MKKIKLFSLIAAALFAGSAMAASYIPQGVKEVTENTIVYAADVPMGTSYTPASNWIGCPTTNNINETKNYTNVTDNITGGNPKGLTDNMESATDVTMSKLAASTNNYNKNGKVIHMHVKGISEIIVHGITGSKNRGMAIGCNEFTSTLTEASEIPVSASVQYTDDLLGSFIVNLADLDSSKEYIISIWAVGGDAYFYAAELITGATCTDAGLLLADNPDIEINESEALVAPALTNPNNVAVTYKSSDETVVKVAADGTLTKVGAGEAVITISAARQTVSDVLYCADELTYNVKIKSLSPVLEATESALDFSLNAFETTKSATLTVSGYNLTGEASVSTLPTGFTLDPDALTVVDGAVEQAYTLTYTAEAAVEASNADLVFAVGETTVTIALTYGKKAKLSQTTVSGDITWDWTKASATKEIKLTADTKPAKNDTILLADYDGIINDETFRSDALLVSGEYLMRDSKYFQGGYISFNTDKAGTVQVEFSNTGNRSNADTETRYLYVNGAKTAAGSLKSSENTTSDEIAVPAGKVEITFMLPDEMQGNQYGRVYKVIYKVSTSTTIGESQVEATAVKVMRDGQLVIIREGKIYTAQGVELR